MGDDGGEPDGEWIEGWLGPGRDINKIAQRQKLQEIKTTAKEKEISVNKKLAAKENECKKTQTELNKCNEDLEKQKEELEKLHTIHAVTLDSDERKKIMEISKAAIEEFLEVRPPDMNEERAVHVHFLVSGDSEVSLRTGGEGAGSHDAKFRVQLRQTVKTLATQAAKYWGLDVDKVFFLDRDGRVVPDDIRLADIILPPKKELGRASDELATVDEQKHWTVTDDNYQLTLVRAGTVIDKEDLNKPRGEKQEDFTFDLAALKRDLDDTKKKRGITDNPAERQINDIPSLHDMMQEGEKRKQQRLRDTINRAVELLVFVTGFVAFHALLRPDRQCGRLTRAVGQRINRSLSVFEEEEIAFGVDTFQDITREASYKLWLQGPLTRTVVDPGVDDWNLFLLAAVVTTYEGPSSYDAVSDMTFCSSATTTTTCTNSTNMTCGGGDQDCIDYSLRTCHNERVVSVLDRALGWGQQAPACMPTFGGAEMPLSALSGGDFSAFVGQIHVYDGGTRDYLNVTSAGFQNSLNDLSEPNGFFPPARTFSLFYLTTTCQIIIIVRMIVENTASGVLVCSSQLTYVDLSKAQVWEYIVFISCILLSLVVLGFELRRQWRSGLSLGRCQWRLCWGRNLPFFLLPMVQLAGFITLVVADSFDSSGLVTDFEVDPDDALESLEGLEFTERIGIILKLINLLFLDSFIFRFALMYFPQLLYTQAAAQKLVKPLLAVMVYLMSLLIVFGTWFHLLYGIRFSSVRNFYRTLTSMLLFFSGGLPDWQEFYMEYKFMFGLLIFFAFIFMTLLFVNIAMPLIFSHRKERDLRSHNSYHTHWTNIRSHKGEKPEALNPALVGWDFSKNPPKEVRRKET